MQWYKLKVPVRIEDKKRGPTVADFITTLSGAVRKHGVPTDAEIEVHGGLLGSYKVVFRWSTL